MKWLTRMELSAAQGRAAGLVDSYAWHRRLWECFPEEPDKERDFLTRIDVLEKGFTAWLLSPRQPACPVWCPANCFQVREITPSFFSHQYYAFDVRVNPVKSLVQRDENGQPLLKENGKRKSGKRVPLIDPEELRTWLVRKGEIRCRDQASGEDIPGGFRLVADQPLEIRPQQAIPFRKKGQRGWHGGIQFRGVLEVVDKEHFFRTYQAGIGSAKGFGFGLLLLAPVTL